MGCCASSATTDRENDNLPGKNKTAPIPTIVEEETVVKEVLSEFTSAKDPVAMTTKIQECEEKKLGILKLGSNSILTRPDLEEGSEVSEICSVSVSESVSTSTAVNCFDEEEMKQRRSQGSRQNSPAKSRTRVTGNPTRRSDQSPRKRNVSSGGCGGGSVRVVHTRSGSGIRDPGERSGRRSRSPAMNRSVMDPNQSCGSRRKNNYQSPGRVRLEPNKNGSDQQHRGNYGYATEDPLVSLECFIFL